MTKKNQTPKSARFNEEELEIVNEAIAIHGSFKKACMAGFGKIVTQGRVSKSDIIAWVESQPDA